MELLMKIDIVLSTTEVVEGKHQKICMIDFTGKASGPYFTGEVIGTGVDTQFIKNGVTNLSARYMLEGTDANNEPCRVFIENNGDDFSNCKPQIVTDSKLLADWETSDLRATVTPGDGGVTIHIYKL
ncbi:MAG: DUF3237 family protein [Lachnospiraceae bacterium]|nr:DUF3237 family protein [Lachnospiraceae bacterium]